MINLKDWRERLGFNKAQMARYLGVNVMTYYKWEKGERNPPAVALRLMGVLQQLEAIGLADSFKPE